MPVVHTPSARSLLSAIGVLVVLALTVFVGCSGGTAPDASPPAGPSTSVGAEGGGAAGGVRVSASPQSSDSTSARPEFDEYVALGDSYSSAPGVPTTDSQGCRRSDRNYPHLLVGLIEVASFHDVTCAGARTADLTGSQRTRTGPVAPQLDALTRDTDLVTLGIGVNDLDLMILLAVCLDEQGRCVAEAEDRLPAGLRRLRADLGAALREIDHRSPDAEVVVVGYPQLFAPHGCRALPVSDADARVGAYAVSAVNRVLADVAGEQGATYVDIEAASAGHEICSSDPWINGAFPSSYAARLHPFPAEQQAVAGLVHDALVE